ncbi:MAG: 3'(2'),5'-bisphosphate nucleotidase CysQ [Candidatus Schekmanbacteria bacterium]|nr:3'(2'),5'-bisphosphate nucleotidase CysQ [Candidatus Schekmanbacteria bacterium]
MSTYPELATERYGAELAAARRLAFRAGIILLRMRDRIASDASAVWAKDNAEPVTAADVAANRYIVEALKASFPEDGVVAEESADISELERDRVWFVDPLDGTREYLDGRDDYAVMIGLAVAGSPVVGAVFQPQPGLLSWAMQRQGGIERYEVDASATEDAPLPAPLDTFPLQVSTVSQPERMTLVVSRSHRSDAVSAIAQRLGIESEVRRGSVGVKVTMLACRHADLYLHPSSGTRLWDTCAPHAILVAAGGMLTKLDGSPIVYGGLLEVNRADDIGSPMLRLHNRDGFAATNGRAHDRVLQAARQVLEERAARGR